MSALFDQPAPTVRHLSRRYSTSDYQAGDDTPKWTPIRNKVPLPCDECFAEQIENQGTAGPRAIAKARRSVRGTRLDLCRAHEDLWKVRDIS